MLVRVCCVLLLVSAVVFGSPRAQDVPGGEAAFTDYVAGQMRREVKGAQVEVKGPLTLGVGGLQANLDRIYIYCGDDAKGCRREIANYVKAVAQTLQDRSAPLAKEVVRIIVRTKGYVKASSGQKVALQARPLAGELMMLPAAPTLSARFSHSPSGTTSSLGFPRTRCSSSDLRTCARSEERRVGKESRPRWARGDRRAEQTGERVGSPQ